MNKILPLVGAIVFLLSCSHIDRIKSLDQLEPALRKYVGNPSRIDTTMENKKLFIIYNFIHYDFNEVSEVSFEDIVSFLSQAYDCEPTLTIEEGRKEAKLKPIPDNPTVNMLQVLEYYGSKDNKRYLGFTIIDVNNELVTPSSQTPQTSVPLK